MTTNLNVHRLLKAYQSAAADGFPGGQRGFAELADLAEDCLTSVSHEQWMPAVVVQNIFDALAQDEYMPQTAEEGPAIAPELHEAIVKALKYLITDGDAAFCLHLSERLIRLSPISQPR